MDCVCSHDDQQHLPEENAGASGRRPCMAEGCTCSKFQSFADDPEPEVEQPVLYGSPPLAPKPKE
jgi:hypothetical protein